MAGFDHGVSTVKYLTESSGRERLVSNRSGAISLNSLFSNRTLGTRDRTFELSRFDSVNEKFLRRSRSPTFEFELTRFCTDSYDSIPFPGSIYFDQPYPRSSERSSRSEYNYPRGGRKIISARPTAMHHPREPIGRASLTTVRPRRARSTIPRLPRKSCSSSISHSIFPPGYRLTFTCTRRIDVAFQLRGNPAYFLPAQRFFRSNFSRRKKETTSFPYFVHSSESRIGQSSYFYLFDPLSYSSPIPRINARRRDCV